MAPSCSPASSQRRDCPAYDSQLRAHPPAAHASTAGTEDRRPRLSRPAPTHQHTKSLPRSATTPSDFRTPPPYHRLAGAALAALRTPASPRVAMDAVCHSERSAAAQFVIPSGAERSRGNPPCAPRPPHPPPTTSPQHSPTSGEAHDDHRPQVRLSEDPLLGRGWRAAAGEGATTKQSPTSIDFKPHPIKKARFPPNSAPHSKTPTTPSVPSV